MKQSKDSINRTLAKLRKIIETNGDPDVTRIAYAVEQAIRWATIDTRGWQRPETAVFDDAKALKADRERVK
jgi:hypothetical protein